MSYWLQDWTWQVSWVRGARWQWVSLDLRDLSILSRKLSYRNPVTLMCYTLGPAPWIPCPFVGTPWRVGSRVTEFYSSIVASLPSDTGSTSRKRSCSELDDENHDNDRVDRYDDRWFVVQSVDSDHPISKLSPFLLSKAIKSAVGTVKTLRRLRNGDFLLEVSSAVQSRI